MRLALRPEVRSGLMASTCSGGSDAALRVEGAVVNLSAWERQTLDLIGNGLAESDPELATLLTTFARLASGEEMPEAEEISPASWPSMRRSHRERRRPRWGGLRRFLGRMNRGLAMRWLVLSLWLAITACLMCITLFLGNGSGVSCSVSWAAACTAPAAPPAADKTATSHAPAPSHAGRPAGGAQGVR
jgi:hypothetical protein